MSLDGEKQHIRQGFFQLLKMEFSSVRGLGASAQLKDDQNNAIIGGDHVLRLDHAVTGTQRATTFGVEPSGV